MKTEKINTISGEQLMKLDLPPMKYVVGGLLPQGLHILAGAPKTGKSWLLLQLCLKVTKGERANRDRNGAVSLPGGQR